MDILDGFSFEVRDTVSGDVKNVLTVEEVAALVGDDVIDLGAALEWYSQVAVPPADDGSARFLVTRIPVAGRA